MYFPDDTIDVKLLSEKTKCLVVETFVGEIYIAVHNNIYKAIELTKENSRIIELEAIALEVLLLHLIIHGQLPDYSRIYRRS